MKKQVLAVVLSCASFSSISLLGEKIVLGDEIPETAYQYFLDHPLFKAIEHDNIPEITRLIREEPPLLEALVSFLERRRATLDSAIQDSVTRSIVCKQLQTMLEAVGDLNDYEVDRYIKHELILDLLNLKFHGAQCQSGYK